MAVKQEVKATTPAERTSEVQLSLTYAQQVATTVTERRRADLKRRLDNLSSLPLTCTADIDLRNDLMREINAALKRLDRDE